MLQCIPSHAYTRYARLAKVWYVYECMIHNGILDLTADVFHFILSNIYWNTILRILVYYQVYQSSDSGNREQVSRGAHAVGLSSEISRILSRIYTYSYIYVRTTVVVRTWYYFLFYFSILKIRPEIMYFILVQVVH